MPALSTTSHLYSEQCTRIVGGWKEVLYYCTHHPEGVFLLKKQQQRGCNLIESWLTSVHLGDNCIQNFHLGRYIFWYTVRNLVLRRRVSGAVKRDFPTYIRRYTSPNENFEYGYPRSISTISAYTSSDASCIKPLASCIKPLDSCIYSPVNQ